MSGGVWVFIENRCPVSYTHLDVYKRQHYTRPRPTHIIGHTRRNAQT